MARRPKLFAVVSWGNAGTHWLAKLLNAHPDVFCVHNLRNKIEPQGRLATNRWLRWARRRLEGSRAYLEILAREARSYPLAGDVHGVPLHDVAALRTDFGERIRFAVLTRHPVLRVRSHLNLAAEKGTRKQWIRYGGLRRSLDAELRGALTTREQLFFVHVMNLVSRLPEEWAVGPVFPLEQLSRDEQAANALLEHLSQGELRFPPGMLAESGGRRVAEHTRGRRSDEPAEVFDAFPAWQRDAFRRLLAPEARELYEKLGYDFGFL